MSFAKRHDDRYETALDDVIAQCGGDTLSALKALLAANEYLEAELSMLHAVIDTGGVPLRGTRPQRDLMN